MVTYIWQQKNWPHFTWNAESLLTDLAGARRLQGRLLGNAAAMNLKDQGELLVEETLQTSAIEGEQLDPDSIRSSVARRLGLPDAGLPRAIHHGDALVEVLLDATRNHHYLLTADRLRTWQSALFPGGHSGLVKITTGAWRNTQSPMRVISGSVKNEVIHFEAPPSDRIDDEMNGFLRWWKTPPFRLDGILRAAIAHFYFVTIHPFEDGNGRIARALTDMALAQDEETGMRLYSLSSAIIRNRSRYYDILETTQKGTGDLTDWMLWFLKTYTAAIEDSMKLIGKSLYIRQFYQNLARLSLRPRQLKIIDKLLEAYPAEFAGGLTNRKYVAVTKVSPETAKRDLKELLKMGLIRPGAAGGRSTYYELNKDFS
jgi:Fic family protein